MNYELELRTITIGDIVIKIFVPTEDSVKRIYREQRQANNTTPFPYWAKLWPAALGLSTFLQQQSQFITGKEVLELAAGMGVPSLLAARYASRVIYSDYLPEALDVVEQSIDLQSATNLTTRLLDWHRLPPDLSPEVLLLSDINYDPQEFEVLYKVLKGFLQKKTTILLSTPQRLMAKPFIERLLPWCVRQEEMPVSDKGETLLISVLVLQAQ